jgi:hypothetical protein
MRDNPGDNPLDRIPAFDRVSIRAVVVPEGEDPGPALAAAGIVDPIALPMVFGESAPDRSFGDGFTPNVSAVLEYDAPTADDTNSAFHDHDPSARPGNSISAAGPGATGTEEGATQPSGPNTINLPAAYGSRPLAPVRSDGGTGRSSRTAPPALDRFRQSGFAAGMNQPAPDSDGPRRRSDPGKPVPSSSDFASDALGAGGADKSPDGDPGITGLASPVPPDASASDPFHLSQEEIERRYYNESFLNTPVSQNQHEALREATLGLAAAGALAGVAIESMTEGAAVGSLAGPLGAAAGAVIGAVIGGGLGLIAGGSVGAQKDRAQGIPPLSPSQRK